MTVTLPVPSTMQVTTARVGKILLAAFVFVSIMALWMMFGKSVLRHVPLPGMRGPEGPCAVWVVGSSTVHRWTTMSEDLAPWIMHNRGVDGALVDDIAARLSVEKVDSPPGTMIVYIGENDIADGIPAAQTATKVAAMVGGIQRRMPGTRTIVLGMKPSPTRWSWRAEQLRYNALAAALVRKTPNTTFADLGPALLVNGWPGPYYDAAGIHLNREGYRLWSREARQALERVLPPADVARCSRPTG